MSKTSKRRIEDTPKVEKKLGEIDWTKHKPKSKFKYRVNGKVVNDGVA